MSTFAFEKLPAWKKSMQLVRAVYKVSALLPATEKSGLVAIWRKTVTSIPARIASGHGRPDADAFAKAVCDAMALLRELQTHVAVAEKLHYLSRFRTTGLRRRIGRLHDLLDHLSASLEAPKDTVGRIPKQSRRVAA